jgi:hypothetical protein
MQERDVKEEDDYLNRDAMGLQVKQQRTCVEAEERLHYFKLYATLMTNVFPLLVWLTYTYLLPTVFGSVRVDVDRKLGMIVEYQLGYVYLTWYIIFLTRYYLAINANGARASAKIDRPDQYIFEIKAKEGALAQAPYVLMADTGTAGRFNRAQRAAANTDEYLPAFLTGSLLVACVFGPVMVVLAGLYMYGRVSYGNRYKANKAERLAGYIPQLLAEQTVAAFVGFIAVKTLVLV